MKFSLFSVSLLAVLTPLVSAWSKEDREIFRVRDEIISLEGADVTFYDVLGIASSASQDEITRAYRQKSRSLHPDKVRQQLIAERTKQRSNSNSDNAGVKPPSQAEIRAAVKIASEKQAHLGLIANILRGPERDRYDHFLSNGFPVWKGTNYYYNRYRPGLGTAMMGVFLVGGGAIHYLALYMSWKRQKEFVERYINFARQSAWGESVNIAPIAQSAPQSNSDDGEDPSRAPKNRRERRMQQRETRKEEKKGGKQKPSKVVKADGPSPSPSGMRKRVVAENGKVLLVDSLGDVYLEGENEEGAVECFLLDPNELPRPTFKDTAVVRIPTWAFSMTIGRFFPTSNEKRLSEEEAPIAAVELDSADEASDSPQITPSSGSVADDFELLDKSVDSLNGAKSTSTQLTSGGKKRKGRKQ